MIKNIELDLNQVNKKVINIHNHKKNIKIVIKIEVNYEKTLKFKNFDLKRQVSKIILYEKDYCTNIEGKEIHCSFKS